MRSEWAREKRGVRRQKAEFRIQESEFRSQNLPHADTPHTPKHPDALRTPDPKPRLRTLNSELRTRIRRYADTPTRPYPPLPRAQVGKAAKVFLWQRRGVITALARIQSESHERFDKFYPSSDAVDDWNADFPADDFA